MSVAPTAVAQIAAAAKTFAAAEQEAALPLLFNGTEGAEVRLRLRGEELVAIEKESLLAALRPLVDVPRLSQLEAAAAWVAPKDVGLSVRYDPTVLALVLDVPPEQQAAHRIDVNQDPEEIYGSQALRPAPFGGAINYRLEQGQGAQELGGKTFSAYLDSFVNMGGVVLENQSNYQTTAVEGTGWFRGDTRLVKDFPRQRVRASAGDVYPASFGFMPSTPVGGVMIARNFTLNPYIVPFPQGDGRFLLRTRSRVRTFVNGAQVKDETLPAGNYDLRDVPLANGLNTVLVEVTDELGEKRVYQFRLPTSVQLLRGGDWNFSFSHGRPFTDDLFHREYRPASDELTSAYVQHGLTDHFSLGAYGQRQEQFRLMGLEAGMATLAGNFFVGAANGGNAGDVGDAGSLTWQFQRIGQELFSTYTLTARHERYSGDFRTTRASVTQTQQAQTQFNITLPLQETLTASLGILRGDARDPALEDRRGWDATLNVRALRNFNVNFFVSRVRDEYANWNDVAYAFFTWTFDGANHLVSGFHDFEEKVSRLNVVRDNNNRLYSPRLSATAEEGPTRDAGELDGFVPTPMADFGGRVAVARYGNDEDSYARGVARVASALVFAYREGEMGVGFSRPVPNSFVLFRPTRELRRQKVALKSTSPFTEGESGPFGEITFTNLLPYQYREIQLDPSRLDEGTSLVQEKFVIYPTYRSAHLIPLRDKGTVVLTGVLRDRRGNPLGLRVGSAGGRPFFTTREGRFFIEGLDKGTHLLKLAEEDPGTKLTVSPLERGVKDLGDIVYEEAP
jgi:outer membrane usher protein